MRCAICSLYLYNQTSTTEAASHEPLSHIHAAASYQSEDAEIAICYACNRQPKMRNQFWAMVARLRSGDDTSPRVAA